MQIKGTVRRPTKEGSLRAPRKRVQSTNMPQNRVQSAHPQKRSVQCADPHSHRKEKGTVCRPALPVAGVLCCPPQRELHTQPRSQCHRVVQTHNYASASLEFAPKLPGPRSCRQNLYVFVDLCLVLSYFVLFSPDGKPTVGSSAT